MRPPLTPVLVHSCEHFYSVLNSVHKKITALNSSPSPCLALPWVRRAVRLASCSLYMWCHTFYFIWIAQPRRKYSISC